MEVSEAIRGRRSVRHYRQEPVARDLVEQVLEAARWAPSAKNVQPWRLLVVEGKTKNQLAKVLGCVAEQMIQDSNPQRRALGYGTKMSAAIIHEAPVLITVWNAAHSAKTEAALLTDPNPSRLLSWSVRIQSIAAAIQNMLLMAHSLGLGGLWICDLNHAAAEVKAHLSVSDDLVAGVTIGYAQQVPPPPHKYSLADIVTWVGDGSQSMSATKNAEDVHSNEFLDRVCVKLKARRPHTSNNFNLRIERVKGIPFVNLWFRTRGCRHDHQGGCTMCNYDSSAPLAAAEITENVRQGLSAYHGDERAMLLASPSGSMFDQWEVPGRARQEIFQLIRAGHWQSVICETRVDTITEEDIRQYADLFADREACIEVGLESADPWVLKFCVNKAMSIENYKQIMLLLRKYKVTSLTNVMLGCPFLTTREAIKDTVQSVLWAFAQGTNECVLFPAHVKRWTLLQWLWEHQMYSPPSLWSLVEVLYRLGPQWSSQVTISWYKNYQLEAERLAPLGDRTYLRSPTTCPICEPQVMRLLDDYRDNRGFGSIQELVGIECECKNEWRSSLEKETSTRPEERVAELYEAIGLNVLGVEWWTKNGSRVLEEIGESPTWVLHNGE